MHETKNEGWKEGRKEGKQNEKKKKKQHTNKQTIGRGLRYASYVSRPQLQCNVNKAFCLKSTNLPLCTLAQKRSLIFCSAVGAPN